jgi:ferredoxin-NADP reductase
MSTIETSAASAAARVSFHAGLRARALGLRATQAVVRRLALGDQVDFWLREIDGALSVREGLARVVAIHDETHDVKTFVLSPNAQWWSAEGTRAPSQSHRAGQFVTVGVEVRGVRTSRCYSLSSAPGARRVAITVKRARSKAGTPGVVSSWLHDHVKVGDVLRLGPPVGDFILPQALPGKILLLSGGSGVTPVMAILRDLAARFAIGDVVFVHAARARRDVVFHRELCALSSRHAGLRLAIVTEDTDGRLDEAKLRAAVPDLDARATWLCGPPGMMAALAPIWSRAGMDGLLRTERFVGVEDAAPLAGGGGRVTLRLATSGREIAAEGSASLLDQLERGGATPAYGCRMGICNTCRCVKRAGVVEDMRTGALSSEPDEEIRLCVSRARTDIELAL